VWLCGAGPGDLGHLTLHAVSALQQADHLVYDALVDPGILGLARDDAVREFAGKRGGRPSPTQDDITARLVELARTGVRVLRLKGGDPFVFGRGGEEALALVAAGIPFRVIPGLTAGIAGLAAAGIPATMRGINRAVVLATGQTAEGSDAIDWEALARLGQPLVLYMAVRTIGGIAARLMGGGMAADTPAAVVSEATTVRQVVLVTTLEGLEGEIAQAGLRTPAMIVIGGIVQMRDALAGLL
jgi:uroporphyrin-III C-methyltransferase